MIIRSCVTCQSFLSCQTSNKYYMKICLELPGKDCWKKIRRGELMDEMARKCKNYLEGKPPLPLEMWLLGVISLSNDRVSNGKEK